MPRLITIISIFIATILCNSLLGAPPARVGRYVDTQPTIQSFNKMPLSFTKNMGQWDERVLFRTKAGGATIWITKEGITYQFIRRIENGVDDRRGTLHVPAGTRSVPLQEGLDSRLRGNDKGGGNDMERDSVEQLVLTAKFVNANPNPEIIAEGQMEYKCNYFLGNDPAEWHTDVPNYEAITLKDIYPGIDLRYSGDGNGQASYEFIAAPGADIAQIKVAYEGAESTSLDSDGILMLKTKWGDMTAAMNSPRPLGEGSGVRVALFGTASFAQLSANTVGFDATGGASQQALGTSSVGLVYSTYLGAGGADYGYSIAVDDSGNAYVTGNTNSSSFPTQNPYQTDQGGDDVFVTKLSSSGSSLIYSTYLGGGDRDYGQGIAVDSEGSAYVTGYTWSSDFPTQNAYQTDQGERDAFVVKLSTSGSSLIYSTYLGGGTSDYGNGIVVDGGGEAYVTGITTSSDFPTLNPYQTFQGGSYDAFVSKLNSSGSSLIYSTYLGGGEPDWGYGIAVDSNGNAHVTGMTYSADFPTLNAYQTFQGVIDVFVTKLSSSGNSLIYSTYLGGGDQDEGHDIAVDSEGNAYVTGRTLSSNFPTLNPYQMYQGNWDAFVTKLSGSGTNLIFSTYLGAGDWDEGHGIAIDGSGNSYVVGKTLSVDFPTRNPYQTDQWTDDAFVTIFSSSGNSLMYSTYLGGEGPDYGEGIAVDDNRNAYVTGMALSIDFPTLNPYQTVQGDMDAFVTKLNSVANAPTGVILISPSNTLITPLVSLRPTFSWTAATDPDPYDTVTYNLTIALDSTFGFVQQISNLTDTSNALTFDLQWGRRYWWKIKASDKHGSEIWSPQTFTFRTMTLGDANNDGTTNISDAVYLIAYIFSGGLPPYPLILGDANCDGTINISDAVYLIAYIFAGGPAPCSVL